MLWAGLEPVKVIDNESVCSVYDTLHLTVYSQHGMPLSKDSVNFWSGHEGHWIM